jgi:hypothetical protein
MLYDIVRWPCQGRLHSSEGHNGVGLVFLLYVPWLADVFLDINESCLSWSPQIRRRGMEVTMASAPGFTGSV